MKKLLLAVALMVPLFAFLSCHKHTEAPKAAPEPTVPMVVWEPSERTPIPEVTPAPVPAPAAPVKPTRHHRKPTVRKAYVEPYVEPYVITAPVEYTEEEVKLPCLPPFNIVPTCYPGPNF